MFKVAICDDEVCICSQLEKILLAHSKRSFLKIEIETFLSGEELFRYILCNNFFDLIYLDIEMGDMSGIDVGKELRKKLKDYKTEIVFISGKDQYDRQLFDVQPLHFIPKPINAETVIKDLELAIEKSNNLNAYFKYKKRSDSFKIPIEDIIYFESMNREIRIVTVNGEDFFYGLLKDVFLTLANHQFVKIHRSYVINYHHTVSFKYDEVTMSNDKILPISQSKRKEIRAMQLNSE
ncbi:two component transcriptional regulator, LytTR family [Clostridium collagenovorans DSM 3089]|uniref:Stage 0 sporulation protein A homolog n=1 Tax=Clostridium collagenovorans DSM 3089 TaxID=1121306 RepID=A0A1M5V761_9CLOT|nr:LytTR family DNA-binding domain-containing protein [Clostridium collagenovorans]SHH71099.1 two component transcriptional regulator, LytTR family [Clostridium collagenovorans DSM 3089]